MPKQKKIAKGYEKPIKWADNACWNIIMKAKHAKIIGTKICWANLFLYKMKPMPTMEMSDIKNIPISDKEQLYINIEVFRLSAMSKDSLFETHTEILFPAKNWIAPIKPPLWISFPAIPILDNKDDPSDIEI